MRRSVENVGKLQNVSCSNLNLKQKWIH